MKISKLSISFLLLLCTSHCPWGQDYYTGAASSSSAACLPESSYSSPEANIQAFFNIFRDGQGIVFSLCCRELRNGAPLDYALQQMAEYDEVRRRWLGPDISDRAQFSTYTRRERIPTKPKKERLLAQSRQEINRVFGQMFTQVAQQNAQYAYAQPAEIAQAQPGAFPVNDNDLAKFRQYCRENVLNHSPHDQQIQSQIEEMMTSGYCGLSHALFLMRQHMLQMYGMQIPRSEDEL